eukprot:TRINITY_DN26384_c0_g1_i1.p1 TRINITY_DN26384_c0_g1~~TRINITY_DN26384_c0_g1_i1.p1  ORF type:complete len:103 (+),score=3.18 TRINITY_DN26384_c0_g1_i1:71-379(+)
MVTWSFASFTSFILLFVVFVQYIFGQTHGPADSFVDNGSLKTLAFFISIRCICFLTVSMQPHSTCLKSIIISFISIINYISIFFRIFVNSLYNDMFCLDNGC